jgi:hypothetical protein
VKGQIYRVLVRKLGTEDGRTKVLMPDGKVKRYWPLDETVTIPSSEYFLMELQEINDSGDRRIANCYPRKEGH